MGGCQFLEAALLPRLLKANQPFAATEDPPPDTRMHTHTHTHTHTLHCREGRGSASTAMPVTPAYGAGSAKLCLSVAAQQALGAGLDQSPCGPRSGSLLFPFQVLAFRSSVSLELTAYVLCTGVMQRWVGHLPVVPSGLCRARHCWH